jgi:hypothetical protein
MHRRFAGFGAALSVAACNASTPAGFPVSGENVTCDASMYIEDGQCAELPSFSDASGPLEPDAASTDGGVVSGDANGAPAVEAGDDASTNSPGAVDYLAPCAGPDDVLFVHATGATGSEEPDETLTSSNAVFEAMDIANFDVSVASSSTSFQLYWDIRSTSTGSYPVNAQSGVYLDLTVGGIQVDTPGTINLYEAQVTGISGAGPLVLQSLLLSFSLPGMQQTITGCLRYTAGPPEAGLTDARGTPADAAADAP